MASVGALDGVRVLDVGQLVQGPQAAGALADLGADVIKIELPRIGDLSRWIMSSPADRRSGFFYACNRGKRSAAIDLRTDAGREAFLRLVETADVVISNFLVGTLEQWGVGYDVAAERNPRIIYGQGSLLGPRGPGVHRQGADLVAQAAGGLISTIGSDGDRPTPVGVTVADHIASQNLALGVMAALLARSTTGIGQRVDVSLLGGQVWAQASEYSCYFISGEVPGRADGGHPMIRSPYGVFETADGHVALVGVGASRRAEFFELMGLPQLADDERFLAVWLAPADRRELFDHLAPVFRTRTTAEWCRTLDDAAIAYAPVNDYALAADDPHMWENGYLRDIDHPEWGPIRAVGFPIELSHTAVEPATTAPELGADTDAVLREIGYSDEQIASMRSSGAIG